MQYKKPVTKTFNLPVVVVGGGTVYHTEKLKHYAQQGWPLIAADGGLEALKVLDLMPHLVIGDADSSVPDSRQYEVITYSEQDTTDFEKCLYTVSAPMIIGFGFTGKRFDHTLAMLHSLQRYGRQHKLIIFDETDCMHPFSSAISVKVIRGTRLSVYPLETSRFTASHGLMYPLDNLTLSPSGIISCSNSATHDHISITPEENGGLCLLVMPASFADALIHRPL